MYAHAYYISLIVKIFCSNHNALKHYIRIRKLYWVFFVIVVVVAVASAVTKSQKSTISLNSFVCLVSFILYFFIHIPIFFSRPILFVFCFFYRWISRFSFSILLFHRLNIMYTHVWHFSGANRCGSGRMLECIPTRTIVCRFMFALTCTNYFRLCNLTVFCLLI